VGPLDIRNDFHLRVAVFNYSILSLLGVKQLFISRIARFSLVNVYYSRHTNYTCLGRLLCLLYSYAYYLIHLKQRALLIHGFSCYL
jgi:hypothetical protein